MRGRGLPQMEPRVLSAVAVLVVVFDMYDKHAAGIIQSCPI